LCCVEAPKTCATYSVVWIGAQLLNAGCFTGGATKFFDTKKLATEVASPQGDPEITAACCTPFAEAKCSDWPKTCSNSKIKVAGNSAPADGSNGKTLTQAKYDELCCVEAPKTCATYSSTWILAQAGNGGCYANSATKFFDTKKLAAAVASPQGDAEITAACCTLFADAKCSDWVKSCSNSSKYTAATNSAPADGSSGKTLTQAKYDELCCVDALLCNEYSGDSDSDGVERQAAAPLLGSLLAVMAIAVA